MAPTRLSPSGGRHLRPPARMSSLSSAPSVGRPAARFAACGRTRAAPSMKWFASPHVRRFPNREVVQDDRGDTVTLELRFGAIVGVTAKASAQASRNATRTAPNVREAGGLVQPRREFPRVLEPADRRVGPTPRLGRNRRPRARRSTDAPSLQRGGTAVAARPPIRLARLAPAASQPLPLRDLLRPLRLGLFPLRDRLAPVAELLSQQLLAARSLGIPVAAGLRAVSLDPLSPRCAAGEHLHGPGRGRGIQLLLVDSSRTLNEGALRLVAAPFPFGSPDEGS